MYEFFCRLQPQDAQAEGADEDGRAPAPGGAEGEEGPIAGSPKRRDVPATVPPPVSPTMTRPQGRPRPRAAAPGRIRKLRPG